MNYDTYKEQFDLWHDFKYQISYVNRFIHHHDLLDRVNGILNGNILKLPKETLLYRARIYNDEVEFIREFEELVDKYNYPEKNNDEVHRSEDNYLDNIRRALMEAGMSNRRGLAERTKSGFWGYDEQQSFVPKYADNIKDGRANPARIKYLYVADQPNTALAEVRPLLENYVSIAQIEAKVELKIADLTFDIFSNIDDNDKLLVYLIMDEYSKPNNNEPFDYISTQYLSEYIKGIGFDGIKYNSSLYRKGRNYVIFNYDKCVAISSNLYKLNDICYDAKCVGPVGGLFGEKDLFHWKLQPYKDESKKKLKESLLLSGTHDQEKL